MLNMCIRHILLIFLIVSFYSCNSNSVITKKENCKPCFFDNYQDLGSWKDSIRDSFFLFGIHTPHLIKDSICTYYHEYNAWNGDMKKGKWLSYNYKGEIYHKNGKIYFIPKNDTLSYIYFDFRMDKRKVYHFDKKFNKKPYLNNDTIKLKGFYNHRLFLEDKFLHDSINDTVYKFRFEDTFISWHTKDLVFFVSIKYGVLGIFEGYININNQGKKEENLYGPYWGNIFSNRYNYKSPEGALE
jgi:hypothetical protein